MLTNQAWNDVVLAECSKELGLQDSIGMEPYRFLTGQFKEYLQGEPSAKRHWFGLALVVPLSAKFCLGRWNKWHKWQSRLVTVLKIEIKVNPTQVSDRMNNPVNSINSLWLALTEIPTFQVACSLLAFVIRYPLALFFYGEIVA